MRTALLISLTIPFLLAAATPPLLVSLLGAILTAQIDVATVALLIGAVAGPLVTFLVAARRFGGRIDTTQAHDLWEESARIREWSSKRIDTLNNLVSRLETRIDGLEQENEQLRADNRDLHRQLVALQSDQ